MVGETEQGSRWAGQKRGVLVAIAITLVVGLVAAAVFAVGRVRSLNAELDASELRAQRSSEDLRALQRELDQARTELEADREEGEERALLLERANRDLRICASESWPRGRPRVTLLPPHGPPGTRVEVVGHCFTSRFWRGRQPTKGPGIGLSTRLDKTGTPDPGLRKSRCELVAIRAGTFEIGPGGRMRGHLVVPRTGKCAQSKASNRMVPGRYELIVGCRRCAVARFQITTPASEMERLPVCSAGDWRFSLKGPERVGGVVLAGVRVDPVAGARCHLTKEITLTLTGSSGAPLPVEGNPVRATVDAVVGDGIAALWAWKNWCGGRGPASVRATMQEKTSSGALGSGPRCDFRRSPSVLQAVPQWTNGVNP